MANAFRYYRFQGHSYCIEFDSEGKPIDGAVLSNNIWTKTDLDLHLVTANNAPISEEQAYLLAGTRKNSK